MKGVINIIMLGILGIISLIFFVGFILIPIYYFLVFYKSSTRIPQIEAKLADTVMKEENVIAKAIQLKPFAFFHRRLLIAITNSRVILIKRGLFGGFVMQDFQWKVMHDAKMEENVLPNICGSNLKFVTEVGLISIDGIETKVASIIYKKAQEEEQAWIEKRRIREIEESRAKSGGVTIQTGQHAGQAGGDGKIASMTEEIEKAKRLLDSGTITDVEFNEIKAKILSKSF